MTPKQIKLLKLMKERGSITNATISSVYTSSQYCKDVIKHLIQRGLVKINGLNFGSYILTEQGKDYLEEK